MKLKAVSATTLTLLLIGMLTLAFNIQPVKASGTIYISSDYTFTSNIYEPIVVTADNIIIDGAGYTLQGTGSGIGINMTWRSNVTLKNVEVTNFYRGIYLYNSSNNVLAGNNASNNQYGIGLLSSSSNNTLAGNTASSNNQCGIYLWSSSNNNTLVGNTASNNQYNFGDSGFNNYVDVSNTVDGKPIYYLIGVADVVYDAETNAGTIYLINSNNVTIRDLTLTKNRYGVLFFNTTNSKIENVTTSNNQYGIYLSSSSNNTLTGNNASNNVYDGIALEYSSDNAIANNKASNNRYNNGISLRYSSNNTIVNNNAPNNGNIGVYLFHSSNNTIVNNNASNHGDYGIYLGFSSRNTMMNNIASNNGYYGIYLAALSSNNVIANNTVSNNVDGIHTYNQCNNNTVADNTVSNNVYGIYLDYYSSNNVIYMNNFINNTDNAYSSSTNFWNSTSKITYTHNGKTYTGYLGNYWSDYNGTDSNGDGVGDTLLPHQGVDYYPLMSPWDVEPPVADAGPDLTVILGTTVTFDGSKSIDDVAIKSYVWTFTDVTPQTLTGIKPKYTFNNVGDFEVTLNVTDYAGKWDTDTLWVYVLPDTTPPIISIVSPENKTYAVEDVPLTFTVSESTSWMGYSLDNQANVTITGNTTLSGLSEGTHNIIIYANDTSNNMGSSSKVYFTIDTTDTTPPMANAGPDLTVEEDTLLTFDGSGSWDNVGIVDYTWAFTDVTPQTLTGVNPTYNFTTPGVYVITLNVTDAAENWDTDTVVITVVDWGHAYMSVGNYIEYEYNFTGTYVGEVEGTIRAEVTEVHGNNYTVRVDYSPTDGSDAWTETFSCLLGEDFMCPLTMMWQAEYVADETVQTKVGTVSAARYTTMGGIPEHDDAIYVHKESKILVLRTLDGQTVMEITDTDIEWLIDTTSPDIEILSPENKTYAVADVPLTFTVSESTSWMGYSLDGQLNVTVAGNTTLSGLLDGSHYVVVYANDTAGNVGTSGTVYFTVDTTPPNIIDVSQTPLEDNVLPEDEVKVNATVIDELCGVKQVTVNYTSGNGTWITVDMTNLVGNVWNATIPAFPYGTNVTYRIIAEDNMNNTITTEDLGYEHQYTVIPEFPTWTSMLLILIVLTVAIFIYKRRLLKTPIH